jgi:serine/threonine protein kinase
MTANVIPADPVFAVVQRALAGQYSLERELGRGGMGIVYLAREVELDRYVALKVLPPQLSVDQETRERFLREARTAASLTHPHLVPIYRVGEVADIVFFTMAFVDGGTLGDRLRDRGPLTPTAATKLLREVAQALAYAHGRGIVHRDIKPDNILIERDSGRVLVSDFGIAAREQTSDGNVMGSMHFMSPEQESGRAIDARSDLYSLGVVGYLALSGKLPVHGRSLATAAPGTPVQLLRAIETALAHDPAARPANAEAFADSLESHAMSRAALPEPIREWLDAKDPWRMMYVAWMLTIVFVATVQMLRNPSLADLQMPITLLSLPLIPASIFQLRIARRVFEAGYATDDLRDALGEWQAEQDASEDSRLGSRPPVWHSIARTIAWSPVFVALSQIYNLALGRGGEGHIALSVIAAVTLLPTLTALSVPIFPRFLRAKEKTLSRLFWNSRAGEWVERVLMRGVQRGIPSHAFRPTERVLGSAVEDLFQSLPKAFREQLRDVPGIITRLQGHAKSARESLTHFEGVRGVETDAGLAGARNEARRQLAESVSALETIRLDLLRLMGGDADLRPTTTVLQAAKRVDSEITRLRHARVETERTINPIGLDLRPHTPA